MNRRKASALKSLRDLAYGTIGGSQGLAGLSLPMGAYWLPFLILTEVTLMAIQADTLPSSHPVVQQHHGDIRSIVQSFDVLTYGKG